MVGWACSIRRDTRACSSIPKALFGLAYLKIGQPSAEAVIAKRAIRVAAIVATVNTNPNLRISLTSPGGVMDARLRKG
jgi:hypothetical protein